MKKKLILIAILACLAVVSVGVTYSYYSSSGNASGELAFATFIFEEEETSLIDIPLTNLVPGSRVSHDFSVTNEVGGKISDVVLEYTITIKTQLLMPLTYELRDVTGTENLLLTCDSSSSRDSENIVVCKTEVIEMGNENVEVKNYRLDVIFPSTYTNPIYAGLVDYVDIEIDSFQKTS